MRELSALREEVEDWRKFYQRIQEVLELARLEDESLRPEITQELAAFDVELARRELDAMLSGKHDRGDALLAIHAGAGGTDSQDWAEMLQRMYLRWAEAKGFETDVLDMSEGEEAGIKSVTIAVTVAMPYGYLQSEEGRPPPGAPVAVRRRAPPAHLLRPGGGACPR
jgi:peptide chain release factor 2